MAAQLENVRVLLVEDQFFMRSLWRTILKGMGIRDVHDAATVDEAMAAVNKEVFHIAIVDYHLGAGHNGADFIRKIRQIDSPATMLMSFIGCTSDPRSEVIADLVDAGAHALVTKPVSAEAARSRIYTVLERRRELIMRGVNRASGKPEDAPAPVQVAARK